MNVSAAMEYQMKQITSRTHAIREILDAIPGAAAIVEKAALFSTTRFLIEDLCRSESENSYSREKAYKLSVHTAAMLGFDDDYGMGIASHHKAATVELASLESALLQRYR